MKRISTILALLLFGILASAELFAQCEPDTVNCKDIGDPGQICPSELPKAGLNDLYDEVVSILPPGSYPFYGNDLSIFYIEIDSVKNLPQGIDYFPNADILYPDTAYCIQLIGTPSQTGEYALAIYITATVDFNGPLRYQVVDDSSLVITVVEGLGTDPGQVAEFQVFQNVPNPFSDFTRLACYSPVSDRVELHIYNILGVQVYQESVSVIPGEHYFEFDGSKLQRGTYFYRIRTSKGYFTGKLLKSD